MKSVKFFVRLSILGLAAFLFFGWLGCGGEDDKGGTLGLTWQNPPSGNSMNWQEAIDYCENLTQDSHSDWRLPTISELQSLIRGCPGTESVGSCGLTDNCLSYLQCYDNACMEGCATGQGPADGCYWPDEMDGICSWSWSSSSDEDDDDVAWFVNFDGGYVNVAYKGYDGYNVRCVR